MSVDLATLGIKVDATEADNAKVKLEGLTKAGAATEAQTKKVTSATAQFKAEMTQTLGAINGNTAGLNSLAQSGDKAAASTSRASAAADDMADRMLKLLNSVQPYEAAQHRANAELAEARLLFKEGMISAEQLGMAEMVLAERVDHFRSKQELANAAMMKGKASMGLATHEMVNMGRQFADVGTMLAMGSSPFMVLVSQGPQIADVLATARARGVSAGAAFTQMGQSLAPIAARLAPIGIAAAGAFAVAELAISQLNKNAKNTQAELGLTDQQMKRLKDSGTDLGVTFGDVFNGISKTAKDALTGTFGPEIDAVSKWWNEFLSDTAKGAIAAVADIVGTFTGAFYAIKATWKLLPSAVGDLAIQAANFTISAVEAMVNKAGDLINGLIDKANEGAAAVGLEGRLSRVGTLSLGRIDNPYAGSASKAATAGQAAYNEGYGVGAGAVQRGASTLASNIYAAQEKRVREAAGDAGKADRGSGRKNTGDGADKATEKALDEARDFIKQLRQETSEIGKNRVELKMLAAERAAAVAPTQALKDEIRATAQAWKEATNAQATSELKRALADEADQLRFETSLIGLNTAAREEAIAARAIEVRIRDAERDGITINRDAIAAETAALLANAKARGASDMNVAEAERFATAMADVAANVRSATEGFGELFGSAGEGMANMLTVMADYTAAQADNYERLAQLQRDYQQGNIDIATYEYERQRAAEQSASAQVAYYGNLIGAAKSFFREGSAGFKVLEGAERAYRLFQFAMQIRSMFMDRAETASSVANSGTRAAADGVAAVAKAIASLPFPLNIAAGAATLAFLVAIGVKMTKGGGGKSATSALSKSDSTKTEPGYNGPRDEYGAPRGRLAWSFRATRSTSTAGLTGAPLRSFPPCLRRGMKT
jgi:trimeric autotransporter adhesin